MLEESMMQTRTRAHSIVVAILAAAIADNAAAQTTIPEVEPNGQKSEATSATVMMSGDMLTGTSTGSGTIAGNPATNTADTFRVGTAALPLGIYRHTLGLASSGVAPLAEIRGVGQTNGVILGGDATFQHSAPSHGIPNACVWYGFGKQEEIYYRVNGNSSSVNPYTATLTTTPINPIQVAGSFLAGIIVVTTEGQGYVADTEIYVYDGNLDPVPFGHNDGSTPSNPNLSTVVINLTAGTYYVAVSLFNTSNDRSDFDGTGVWDDDPLLDFPNVLCCTGNNTSPSGQLTFSVTDGSTTTQVPATQTGFFDIVWARIDVGMAGTPFCYGDGSGTTCPCGNSGSSGNGCASSVNQNGAHLTGFGVPSISSDSMVLHGSGMPNSSALYFQGTLQVAGGAGTLFGDGVRCAGGTVTRLATKLNANGSSSYPTSGDLPISVRGANAVGNVRQYQVWYRNAAAFCTPSTFNMTNGLQVLWVP
jgi:hypothetical protein